MALIAKRIADIFTDVRLTLQDQQKTRWDDQELYSYLDQAVRNIALVTKSILVKDLIHVADPTLPQTTTDYTLSMEAIEFYKIHAEQKSDVIDARTVRFEDNKEEQVVVEYYAFPPRIIYGATTEISLEEDEYDTIKYFLLYRAYQKEASTENIQKAQYFMGQYFAGISAKTVRWHGLYDIKTSRTEYL